MNDLRPNKAEKKFLTLAYNRFLDIFDEVSDNLFWRKNSCYRFCKIKEAFSLYSELLSYPPIGWVIEYIKKNRPPMEAEIGSEVFRFVRNVLIHLPLFENWNKVWVDKDIVNWHKEGLSIDKFLKKYDNHEVVKYRIWEVKKKKMTYVSIGFPDGYKRGNKIYLRDILKEKEGIWFSMVFMKKVLFTQVEEIGEKPRK